MNANPLYNPDQKTRKQIEAERFANYEAPTDMRTMLRVKVRSLMQEAQLIRRKEQGNPRDSYLRAQLRDHRKGILRREARAAQLALAYLRGRPYARVEAFCHEHNRPEWYAVRRNVEKFCYIYNPLLPLSENHKRKQEIMANFEIWTTTGMREQEEQYTEYMRRRRALRADRATAAA